MKYFLAVCLMLVASVAFAGHNSHYRGHGHSLYAPRYNCYPRYPSPYQYHRPIFLNDYYPLYYNPYH